MRIGGVEHPVPPLTLGRFQQLLEADTLAITRAVVAETTHPPTLAVRVLNRLLRWAILRARWARRPLWWLVRALPVGPGHDRVASAAPLVALCVPSVTEDEWRTHGTLHEFLRLFTMYVRAHDWALISSAIRFGEPLAPGEVIPSATEVTSGLLAVAKETGYTIEGLTAMRVDGFYRLVDSLREESERAAAPQDVSPLPGVEYEKGIPAGLAALLDQAKGVSDE